MRWTKFGLASLCGGMVLSLSLAANAAPNISNSLAGFSGDSSQAGTQGDLATAGFSVFSTAGATLGTNDNGTPDDPSDDFQEVQSNPAVVYDGSGAHFGSLFAGDGGRNYMRTVAADFASASFVAEVTFTTTSDDQATFIGLGAGDTALFGTPDWSTQFSSASFWPETQNDKFTRFRTANDVNAFADTTVAGFEPGTHRFRMTFNSSNNQLLGQIDLNYAGGPFVADAVGSNFPIVVTSLIGGDGWPGEPARIFFGGDDGAVFRDLSVQVIPEPMSVVTLLVGTAIAAACGRRRV